MAFACGWHSCWEYICDWVGKAFVQNFGDSGTVYANINGISHRFVLHDC